VLLAVRDLEKEFPVKKQPAVKALRGVSFDTMAGQVTGLVGADGAGKTTLLRIAAGLLVPSAGTVTVLGLDSAADSIEIQCRVGYMPQKFGLYQDLTVEENMCLYADLKGVPAGERNARFRRLLHMTDLSAFIKRRAGALSGGMKQKLGLACSLIQSPGMLLLDEPTVGVDPVSRRELWKIVYEMVEKEGIGVLLSTAYLDEAERCDQVVVLHEGKMLAEGAPKDFREKVAKRTFLVVPPDGVRPREIQTRIAEREKIMDATIRSGRVRVVTAEADKRLITAQLTGPWHAAIESAPPTFEDAFMAMIPRAQHLDLSHQIHASSSGGKHHTGEVVVQAQDLRKRFGDFEAVKGISFEVRRAEIFGLLGPNGAGKSTTFRMLCGLLPITAGEISVAGHNLRRSRARARSRLGYMAQQFSMYGQISVAENLHFYGRAYGLSRKRLRERLQWAYDEFGLAAWREKAAGQLPGGYKQRLAMAAALLHEPEILFLDEPTSGVDPLARREFWLRINGFAQQGVTVVVTTHFMEESEYCDRMLIMSLGKTLATGTPAEIRAMARTDRNPEPTIEDAFIALAEGTIRGSGVAATADLGGDAA
jgi:ABC-2 type transport system ATP-binding protein